MGRKAGIGKKFKCLNCVNCKTRVFRNLDQLINWCTNMDIKPNTTWIDDLINFGFMRLIWCPLQTEQHCSHGFSPRNASPKYSASIEDILESEKKGVVVSNHNKDTFIPDCPYYVTE